MKTNAEITLAINSKRDASASKPLQMVTIPGFNVDDLPLLKTYIYIPINECVFTQLVYMWNKHPSEP